MSRLLETIRLYNGNFSRLNLHQQRISYSFKQVFKSKPNWSLEDLLMGTEFPSRGLFKCRVVYDEYLQKVEVEPYAIKPIQTLRLVEGDEVQYAFKFEDRKQLNALHELRYPCDEILIVKNGMVTDTTYANIAFQKNRKWYTPDTYLLKGTMRQFLLDEDIISLISVSKKNLFDFESFKLINAMLEFDSPTIVISNIKAE